MSKLKGRKPKTKMRSYGEGVELPVRKVKEGLFKKPEFYLADEKFTDIGHGDYIGQDSSKLHGPSKRAIKGKGKKSGDVYVDVIGNPDETQSDPSYLEHVSPINKRRKKDDNLNKGNRKSEGPKPMHSTKKQKEFEEEQGKKEIERFHETGTPNLPDPILKKGYTDQTSMHSAVQRWNSSTPLMQYDPTGVGSKEDSGTSTSYTQGAADKGLKGAKKRKEAKAEKDAETAKKTGLTTEEVKKGKVLTDDQKAERRDKMKGVAYDIGRAMQAFAGWDVAEARGKKDDKKEKKDDEGTLTEKAGKNGNVTEGKGDTNDGEESVINIGGEKGQDTGILGKGIVSTTTPTKRKGKPKKGGKAEAVSKTPKKPVSGIRPR